MVVQKNFTDEEVTQLVSLIKNQVPDVEIKSTSVTKTNDQELVGLTVTFPNSNIGPTIYLNSFYEKYQTGTAIEKIAKEISEILKTQQNACKQSLSMDDLLDTKNLTLAAVNTSLNGEMLKDIPHFDRAGLSFFPKFIVENSMMGRGTIKVTNKILSELKLTKDEVFDLAKKGMEKRGWAFKSIFETLTEMMPEEVLAETLPASEEPQMYVLSTSEKIDGAALLASKDVMRDVSRQLEDRLGFKDDFYILPSSIHEVLIVPKSVDIEVEELQEMVRSVNRSEVAPEEVLSDEVFYWSVSEEKLSVAQKELKETDTFVDTMQSHRSQHM